MAGNILIGFDAEGIMKVDYKGDRQSMFGFNDVDLLRAIMALEGMFVAQTDMTIAEMRDILDDERVDSKVSVDTTAFGVETAVVVEDDDGEVS